jgi:hypothetical protein
MSSRSPAPTCAILLVTICTLLGGCAPPSPTPDAEPAPSVEAENPLSTAIGWAEQAHPSAPVLVSLVVEHEGYGAALALPFGYRLQHIFLRRQQGIWEVIAPPDSPSRERLLREGFPEAVLEHSDSHAVVETWMAQLQDPRGSGAHGSVRLEGMEGSYARVCFQPADLRHRDPVTEFLHHDGAKWHPPAVGTTFEPEMLRELGVPESLHRQDMNAHGHLALRRRPATARADNHAIQKGFAGCHT